MKVIYSLERVDEKLRFFTSKAWFVLTGHDDTCVWTDGESSQAADLLIRLYRICKGFYRRLGFWGKFYIYEHNRVGWYEEQCFYFSFCSRFAAFLKLLVSVFWSRKLEINAKFFFSFLLRREHKVNDRKNG